MEDHASRCASKVKKTKEVLAIKEQQMGTLEREAKELPMIVFSCCSFFSRFILVELTVCICRTLRKRRKQQSHEVGKKRDYFLRNYITVQRIHELWSLWF
ncbi:hypothetical protein HPP92_025999 [Vanilla planifolia]|uniref:Uncharacterized protein n=1 Tax=Vanilla planifolia TaxID=51239 RepID=A0A835PHQ7_VANPL|nr:hypothetical protein HPP92_025999 [Vanilla planifolia]